MSCSEPHRWRVRVYWEDTDAGGVVYYANYLKFMERARSEWLRELGFDQSRLRDDAGAVFVVRRVEADYHAPARLDDEIEIETRLCELGRAKLVVSQRLQVAGALRVEAVVTLVCVAAGTFKPVKIPPSIQDSLPRP